MVVLTVHNWHKPDPHRNIAYNKTDPSIRSSNDPGVLFLGGLASDMEGTKARFLEGLSLELGFSYTRFDYTGHGKSSGEFSDGSIASWLQDAISILDDLTDGKQILVGSSM